MSCVKESLTLQGKKVNGGQATGQQQQSKKPLNAQAVAESIAKWMCSRCQVATCPSTCVEVGARVEVKDSSLRPGWHDAYVAGTDENGDSIAVTVAINDGGNTTLVSLLRSNVALVAAGEILSPTSLCRQP